MHIFITITPPPLDSYATTVHPLILFLAHRTQPPHLPPPWMDSTITHTPTLCCSKTITHLSKQTTTTMLPTFTMIMVAALVVWETWSQGHFGNVPNIIPLSAQFWGDELIHPSPKFTLLHLPKSLKRNALYGQNPLFQITLHRTIHGNEHCVPINLEHNILHSSISLYKWKVKLSAQF